MKQQEGGGLMRDENNIKVFNTIRETSQLTGLSEKFLRNMHKQNKLPGIYCGSRFMVNYPKLIKIMSQDDCE